jgi:hypothetical protein
MAGAVKLSDRTALLLVAEQYERAGDPIVAGIMRVAAHNDMTGHVKMHRPNIGPNGPESPPYCVDCGELMSEWQGLNEPCPGPGYFARQKMPGKRFDDMTDAEWQQALRQIATTSSSETEIRRRVGALGYEQSLAISSHLPTDQVGMEAQAIVRGLGGPIMASGAMVMIMAWGHDGNVVQI